MFEIKYDRDGRVINDRQTVEELNKLANAAVPQPITQHFPESEPEAYVEEPQVEATVAPEEPEEEAEDQEPTTDNTPVFVAPEPEQDSDAKKSFRELAAAKKRAERERDEYFARLQELESRPAHKQSATTPKEQVEEDEEFHLGADDIAEGKHISKVDKRAQNKIKALEERLSKYEAKTAEDRAETALRTKYADFDKVVSHDNVAMLTEAYPELARTLHSTDDLYTKAVSAYTLIKKFGIYQESPFNSEKATALKNVAKPRPLTSVSPQQGDTALSRANAFANGLTDELKTQLLKEMQASRKSY